MLCECPASHIAPKMATTAAHTGELAHTLRPRHVVMISLGGIIGAGIFVGSSGSIHLAGPAVVVSYTLGGLLVFLIMRMLGEMALARPGLGTFAEYAALGLGRWAGFMTGWLYWYFWVITVGAETVAGANLIEPWLRHAGYAVSTAQIGFALVALLTVTNLFAVRTYGELEFWFATLKVAAIVVFIVVALAFVAFFGPDLKTTYRTLAGDGGLAPLGPSSIIAAIPIVMFSMMGSEVATIAAVESTEPAENVARATRTVALGILIFYVLSISLIVAIVPWRSLEVGRSPFVTALETMHFQAAAPFMSVIVLTAVLSCLNSGIYITSRMLHELAARREAPRFLVATAGNRAPWIGILLSSLAGCLAAAASVASPKGVFLFLINTSGAVILVIYMVIALAQIRLRRRLESERATLRLRMWLYPWLSWLVVAGICVTLVLMAFKPDLRSQLFWSAVSVAVVALAYAVLRAVGGARTSQA